MFWRRRARGKTENKVIRIDGSGRMTRISGKREQ